MPSAPPVRPPPIADVPIMVPCPRCNQVLRTTVSFLHPPPARRVTCPWCARPVVVRAPRGSRSADRSAAAG